MYIQLALYSLILFFAIMLSGKFSRLIITNHTRMQFVMSFVSGLMLGVSIFHLIPHAYYLISDNHAPEIISRWMMLGLLFMFMLQRLFNFHNHDIDEFSKTECSHSSNSYKSRAWIGILIGLIIHSIIDGIALVATMKADILILGLSDLTGVILGLGVFLAILFHKPLDALTITTLTAKNDFSEKKQVILLLLYALICPVAAWLTIFGFDLFLADNTNFVGSALAFSAGIFLCISLSDLLPEIHFHSHDKLILTIALLLGVGLSLLLIEVEPIHDHASHHDHQDHSLSVD